jgi:hydroxymethylpyrimidine/phosphomethylpyrimidine kinase
MKIPRVLIIAGSDSGGGAGIQADLKTVSALGAFGMTAITALTAQNTTGVYGVLEIDPKFVVKQIEVCVSDIGCDAVKTGMLASTAIIDAVAATISSHKLGPLVVDPVMIAKSGAPLLKPDPSRLSRTNCYHWPPWSHPTCMKPGRSRDAKSKLLHK